VPGQFVQPGLSLLADVDPANIVVEANESDNTFPATGTPAVLDVRDVDPLRLTFVPVIQRYDKSLVGNISTSNAEQFLGDARRMLPLRRRQRQLRMLPPPPRRQLPRRHLQGRVGD